MRWDFRNPNCYFSIPTLISRILIAILEILITFPRNPTRIPRITTVIINIPTRIPGNATRILSIPIGISRILIGIIKNPN